MIFGVKYSRTFLFLFLFILTVTSSWAKPDTSGVVVHLKVQGKKVCFYPHLPTPSIGMPAGRKFMKRFGEKGWRKSWVWRTVEAVTQKDFRKHLLKLLRIGKKESVQLHLVADDGKDLLYGDEKIFVPQKGSYRARKKMTLAEVAKKCGVTAKELRDENFERYRVWPYASELRIVAGEWGLRKSCRSLGDVQSMVLHETAHFVDGSKGILYFPGMRHTLRSLLTPALSLHEGWASYWTAIYSKKMALARRRAFSKLYIFPPRGKAQIVEGKTQRSECKTQRSECKTQRSEGKTKRLEGKDLKLAHYLCNSVTVANLLWDLSRLPAGEEGMIEALKKAWEQKAPTIGQVLAQYLEKHPSQRSVVIELLQNRSRNCGSKAEYEKVVAGKFFPLSRRNEFIKPK